MGMLYNVYCDETCHLENDGSNSMVLGAVWCPQTKLRKINSEIRAIKKRNHVSELMEMKWTKISPAKVGMYEELVNYFFDNDELCFRGLIIPNKEKLNHEKYHQTHDTWYYKIYFDMLKAIWVPTDSYEIYIDIKDTHSSEKVKKLNEVCCNSIYDFSHKIIQRLQPIQSYESQIMQIVDVIIGAICRENRVFDEKFVESPAKHDIINLIKKKSGYTLKKTTLLREKKFNLLVWEARDIA